MTARMCRGTRRGTSGGTQARMCGNENYALHSSWGCLAQPLQAS